MNSYPGHQPRHDASHPHLYVAASVQQSAADPILTVTACFALGALLLAALVGIVLLHQPTSITLAGSLVVLLVAALAAFDLGQRRPHLRTPLIATVAVVVAAVIGGAVVHAATTRASVSATVLEGDGSMPGVNSDVLLSGGFSALAQSATGSASVVGLPNGQRQLVIRHLDTAKGPDLQVYLTTTNPTDPHTIGSYVTLGHLATSDGSGIYEIPSSVNLTQYQTVVIWCRLAGVAFAKAPLAIQSAGMTNGAAMQGASPTM